jgi:hypothetical protein
MLARVSSKQIGEDLSNAWKSEAKTSSCPPDQDGNRTNTLTCETSQATKFWPLVAYELSLSVDQEERLLIAHKRYVFVKCYFLISSCVSSRLSRMF